MTALVSSGDSEFELLRSSDHGRTWNRLGEAPKQIFGVAFSDALNGFAWGSDVAYRTEDGGSTWSNKRVGEVFKPGAPWPVVDQSNNLWVATRRIDGEHVSYWLTSFDAKLGERSKVATADRIERMAVAESGLWLLSQQGGYGKTIISKLEGEGRKGILPIVELNDDLPLGFAVRGSRIAVVLSDTSGHGSSRYVLSSDGQPARAWKKFTLGSGDSVQMVCLDAGGRLWAVGRQWLWRSAPTM